MEIFPTHCDNCGEYFHGLMHPKQLCPVCQTIKEKVALGVLCSETPSFRNELSFLSNFYPVCIEFAGVTWSTVEHAYQAAKTEPGDYESQTHIRLADTPGRAKRLGSRVPLRRDWNDAEKLRVMEKLLRKKFSPTLLRSESRGTKPSLCYKLLITGSAQLIERNSWGDSFWGLYKGKGWNHLGRLLMKIREELVDLAERSYL